MECVRCKIIGETTRFNKIKHIIQQHRVNIEAELRAVGKGRKPLPHEVLDKLLGVTDPNYYIKDSVYKGSMPFDDKIREMTE